MEGASLPETVISSSRTAAWPHDTVILRESELGEELGRAIQRVRANDETAHSQILIIAPEPAPGRAELAPVLAPPGLRGRHAAAAAAVAKWGEQLAPLVADLDQLLLETEREVSALAEDVGEGTRARMQQRARVLGEILDWTRAVAGDLGVLAGSARSGGQLVDLGALMAEVLADLRAEGCTVQFVLEPAVPPPGSVELDAARALDLLAGVARLVAARLESGGRVLVQVERETAGACVRLSGCGAVRPVRAPELVARVRELALDLGVGLFPGCSGPEAASLTLVFASPSR